MVLSNPYAAHSNPQAANSAVSPQHDGRKKGRWRLSWPRQESWQGYFEAYVKPPFQWCLAYSFLKFPDLIALLTVYGICLSLRLPQSMYYRWEMYTFPLWYDPSRRRWYGETAISHPREPTVISSFHTAVALLSVPIGVFLLMQLRVRNFWDLEHAIWGLFKAVAVMYVSSLAPKRW